MDPILQRSPRAIADRHKSSAGMRLLVAVTVIATLAVGFAFAAPIASAQFAPGEVCAQPQVSGRLSVFHAFPDAQITVFVNGVAIMTDADPGTSAPLGAAPLQPLNLSVVDDTGVSLFSASGLVFQDLQTVVLLPNSDGDMRLSTIADALDPVPSGKARVQLRYVGIGNEAEYTVRETTGVSLQTQAASINVISGPVAISIRVDGDPLGSIGTLNAVEGEAYLFTIFNVTASVVEVTRETVVVGSGPVADATGTCVESQFCAGRQVTVSLADGQVPTAGDDVILGTPGDDVVAAGDGNDVICGGAGDDTIWGQGGDDVIWGDTGDDRLRGGSGADSLHGGDGSDSLGGGPDNDFVDGEGGDDIEVRGNTGDDVVLGGPGNDLLVAGNGGLDEVFGGPGNDVLVTGGPRPDLVDGGDGDDFVKGNKGADTLRGGAGQDTIRGGPQPDTIDGGSGADTCNGGTTGGDPVAPETDTAVGCEGTLVAIP